MGWKLKSMMAVSAACVLSAGVLLRAAAPAAPASKESVIQGINKLQDAMKKDGVKIDAVLGQHSPVELITNASYRAKFAGKVIPLFRDIVNQANKFSTKFPADAPMVASLKYHYLGLLQLIGDKSAGKTIAADEKSANAHTAREALMAELQVKWWNDRTNAAAQGKILDQYTAMAKAHPQSNSLAILLLGMSQGNGSADAAMSNRARSIIDKDLNGPIAQQIIQQDNQNLALKSRIGKPFSLVGREVNGKTFHLSAWKGKVVLVDFWATWCPPCRASLPHVTKLFEKYHSRGFNIVGVSNDYHRSALVNFLKANKKMVWPQLIGKNQHSWNKLSQQNDVNAIPAQFIVDKKGILRDIVVGYDPSRVTADVVALVNGRPVPPHANQ